ncbi:CHAT domain-containing protein [Leptolyngbya sp. AN02str]|uniref:CHAT domain-containing protein n=1 Tax=Leptolyngbya sp. AN02str TaxID=3423363 RepID=UPI003D311944
MRSPTPKLLVVTALTAFALAAPASPCLSASVPLAASPTIDNSQPTTVHARLDERSQTMEDGSYYNVHTFEGVAGQNVLIEMVSPDFDTYLILFDPLGNKIAENDNGSSGSNAQLVLTLPATGTYEILANSWGASATGDYTLSRREATAENIRRVAILSEATQLNQQVLQALRDGRYAEALPLAQRSLAIREQFLPANHSDIATSLNNLASLYREQGYYDEAEPLYRRSLAIFEQTLPANHFRIGVGLGSLAELYLLQGRYREAEENFRRSLAILEQTLPSNHPFVATSLHNLASLYRVQSRYADAEENYRRSLAISEQSLPANHPDIATSLNNLAELYRLQGRHGEAEEHFTRAIAIREQSLPANHPHIANSLNGLAVLYQDQRRYADAEETYGRSLAIYEQSLPANHPTIASNLNNLAVLHQAQGNLPQSLASLQRSMTIQETNLELNLAIGSEAQKQAYVATISGTTDFALSLHLQSAPTNPEAAHLALTTVLRRKGRVLDAVTDSFQRLRENLTPPDQALLDEFSSVQSQRATLLYGSLDNQTPEQYRTNLDALEQRATELESQLARRSAEFRVETQPVEIAAVQAQIPNDAALVELVRYQLFHAAAEPGEQWGNWRYAAYVLHSQGEPQWVDLGEAAAMDELAVRFREALRSRNADVQDLGRALDTQLMQPIRPLLGQATHLLLSPDSQLNLIPFAALVDEQGKYLVERYLLTHLSSGRDLLRLQNTAPSRQPPLLFGNPNYNTADATAATQVASATRGTSQRSVDFDLKYDPLPGTADELRAISPLFSRAIVLTESAATENALKQANGPNLLHIATHGFFLEDVECAAAPDTRGATVQVESTLPITRVCRPTARNLENPLLRSGLALAGFNNRQSAGEDGVLTAAEVAQLRLRGTQLVVMSACETGVGAVVNGEGVYGLRRAFAIAGAESQMMSLWKVSDSGTAQLMTMYYERLKRGEGRSEALRNVQLELLQTNAFRDPYYWASFVFSGEWELMEGL